MKSNAVILFPVAIKGQLYLIQAFRDEFSVPVVVMTMTQKIEDELMQSLSGVSEKIYSFPDFYMNKKNEINKTDINLLKEEIAEYEQQYNIDSSARFYYCDRYFRQLKNPDHIIRRMVVYYRFVSYVMDRENILFLKADLTTFLGLVFVSAAVSKRIPAIKHQNSRVNGRVEFIDECKIGALRGWSYRYQEINNYGFKNISSEIVEDALNWLSKFRNKPERPNYSERNSVLFFSAYKYSRKLLDSISLRFKKNYWSAVIGHHVDKELGIRSPFGLTTFNEFFLYEIRALIYRRVKSLNSLPDPKSKYIYFPLQFVPEITTLTYAVPNDDQLSVISALSKSIPGDVNIYVKEHTSMIGRRDFSFYKKLDSLHNVKIVSSKLNTFELIDNCIAVATLNGTPGWEAFLKGKPVFCFGESIYQDFPNVLQLNIGSSMSSKIKTYLEDFKPNEEDIQKSIIAYFSVTSLGTIGDIGVDTHENNALSNARNLAKAFKLQLENFPLTNRLHKDLS